jgi:prepilin-type N-terminal cleavage/methylation domain-containing protein
MRQGFSLVELLLVLAVAGLLFGIALPRLSGVMDQIEVASAANHLVAAHQRARIMAVTGGQVLVLTIDTASLVIRPRGQASILWSEEGPAATRVVLEGPARQFTFSPVGLTLGLFNATLRLTRGSASRTIVVSRLGRVRIIH